MTYTNDERRPAGEAAPAVDTPISHTPTGIAMDVMQRSQGQLLLVRTGNVDPDYILRDNGQGLWSDDDGPIASLVVAAALERADTLTSDEHIKQAASLRSRAGTTAFYIDCMARCGAAIDLLDTAGVELRDLTRCHERDLNQQRHAIGTASGLIDLRDGSVIDPALARSMLITIGSNTADIEYDPAARHKLVDTWLGNYPAETMAFLQHAIGFAMYRQPGRRFYVLWGEPASGKTTFSEVLRAVLPGLSMHVPASAVAQQRNPSETALSPQLAPMVAGKALAFTDEGLTKARIDNPRLKELTGGGTIAWRGMRENLRNDRITATLFAFSNTFPAIDLTDEALRERVAPIRLPSIERDKRVADLVGRIARDEQARKAVLAWVLKGSQQQQTLPDRPEWMLQEVATATEHAVGATKLWLAQNIKVTGKHDDFLSTDELWRSLIEAIGEGDTGQTADGVTRRIATSMVKSMHGLPNAKQRRSRTGHERGWHGAMIVVDIDIPDDEQVDIPF